MARMTRGDEMIAAVSEAKEALRKLRFGPHTRYDVAGIVDPLGSRLETFLRTAVLPAASRRDRLVDLISVLEAHGVDQTNRHRLDALRDLYNDSKHKPQIPLLLAKVTNVVDQALIVICDICSLGIGVTSAPMGRELNYSLWVGFWDYFTGGMTEAAVMLPGDHWTHVSTVDTVQMKISDWDNLKPILQAHPRFHLGEAHFDGGVWKSFRGDGDFLNAGVWDGDYAELMRLLAPFHDKQMEDSVIPGSKRNDSVFSVGTAVIMAAVDVARTASAPPCKGDLEKDIILRATKEYAIASGSPFALRCAAQLANALLIVPFVNWKVIAGPVLISRTAEFQNPVEGPLPLALDQNALLLKSF
jgi:hypothetical protein